METGENIRVIAIGVIGYRHRGYCHRVVLYVKVALIFTSELRLKTT